VVVGKQVAANVKILDYIWKERLFCKRRPMEDREDEGKGKGNIFFLLLLVIHFSIVPCKGKRFGIFYVLCNWEK
jgi:hypothetical protein